MDYIPIPRGAQPPLFKFDNHDEFKEQLEKHRHEVHIRTLYAIKY